MLAVKKIGKTILERSLNYEHVDELIDILGGGEKYDCVEK
jgi:hypothetical protein